MLASLRKYRNFRLYFAGQIVSYSGSWMQDTALPWLILRTTRLPFLTATLAGSKVVITWAGAYTLLSATNVTGPYADIISATAPYTNSTSGAQMFFRLRQ